MPKEDQAKVNGTDSADVLTVEPSEETYDLAPPRADALIQSLRSFGYDLPTALADLIDNSIAAEAKSIWLEFFWDGASSHIAVLDDGRGMDEVQLVNAMRAGSRNPLESRDPKDLGRFGLGLKTASFSQAKRLTVASKQGDAIAVRVWDLDYVSECGEWRLLKQASAHFSKSILSRLEALKFGTAVVWEHMDRVTPAGTDVNGARAHDLFLERIDQVRTHIAMTFHRFLDGSPGRNLKMFVNGSSVKGWEPFLSNEIATQLVTEEALSIFGNRLTVRPYILPHHTRLTYDAHKKASGPKGWTAQQGFYIYRNKRLIVAGDWLGLGFQQEEHYKLARIMLDIPNNMDAEWELDVKKSRAWPPPAIRDDLRRLAVATRSRAAEVYRHRGARLAQGTHELTFLWERKVRRSKVFYEINRAHPLVKAALSSNGDQTARVRTLLHLIEETVPIPVITQDAYSESTKQAMPFEEAHPSQLRRALHSAYATFLLSGMTKMEAKLLMLNLEPFNRFKEMVTALDDADFDEHAEIED